mgnify:CR=1 FL=1
MLFDSVRKKVYIGEAKDLYSRLKNHFASPEDKIKDWDSVLVTNDGRSATQSDFNDSVIRKSLELYLIGLLKANKWSVVSQGEAQTHNPLQRFKVLSLTKEINFLLLKKNVITKLIAEPGQEEVLPDELQKLIKKSGKSVAKWSSYEAVIDGEHTYIRPGSKKQKGWQITFRNRFKDALQKGDGYLLVPRDGVLFIPFKAIQKAITDETKYGQNTIDVYINFKGQRVELTYTDQTIDVTQYRLVP